MPFRDTSRERKFALKSIPSAIKLHPDELVIGVDAPMSESFAKLIDELCKKESFENLKIVEINHESQEWGFRLAHIIWECYKACTNDKILVFDVDTVLRPVVLKGYELVGQNNNAVVSFAKKLLIKSASQLIRYAIYRMTVKRRGVFSGIYWIYKPYYFENVILSEFKQISNGIDAFMFDVIQKRRTHKVTILKDIGVNCLDIQNEEYPWRLFQIGVWMYSNTFGKTKQLSSMNSLPKNSARYKIKVFIKKRFPGIILFYRISRMGYDKWVIKGVLWARENKEHTATRTASKLSYTEWELTGTKYIKDVHNWEKHGRTSTGFSQ